MAMSDSSSGKNAVANQYNAGMSQGMLNFFTDEQNNQIMKMISKDKSEEHAANMAGNANSQSLEDLGDYWIVDTGATDHMASNSEMLKTMTGLPDSSKGNVNLPNGKTVPIICKGIYKLTDHDVIHDVLCVPDFKYNLLSVSKLTKELQCSVNFFPTFCVFQDLYTGKVKGIGKEKGGLYLLIPKGSNRNKMAQRISSCLLEGMQADFTTWYRRLGHVPVKVMKQLDFLKDKKFSDCELNNCTVCPLARQTRKPFPLSSNRAEDIFHLIHLSTTPQQNGVVERRHKHVLEVARAFRFQGSIPLQFWGDCVLAAAYLINRLTSSVLAGKSPYEVFHKRAPNMTHLRTIGCLWFATVTEKVDKFSRRAITAIHMGYLVSQKGYKLYDLRRRKFFLKSKEEGYSLHQQQPHVSGEGHDAVKQGIKHGHEVIQQENNFIGADPDHGEQLPDTEVDHNVQTPANEAIEEVQAVQLRRSNRGSKPPIWMQDYVCPVNGASSSTCTYPISNYVNYSALSATYQSYLTATSQETEPTSYTEAMKDP
ncbi:PREDICTED: uncharacterized protein LOC109216595 [Nicotiana attenuata]|uniref:uncharacterized protein LOC109216595 n=1 Tax=Nicotiana attenuata TaxID=49451 RepID=UPI000904901F|nr:PREDICTED: uncharacterized protein LOC109216595 [Nicotiana attenuata]